MRIGTTCGAWTIGLALVSSLGCMDLGDIRTAVDEVKTQAKFGVICNTQISWKHSTGNLVKALRYFRSQHVDSILMVGDPTEKRQKNQYEVFDATCRKMLEGTKIRVIVATNAAETVGIGGFRFAAQYRKPESATPDAMLTFYGQGNRPLTMDECVDGRLVAAGSMRGVSVVTNGLAITAEMLGKMKNAAQGLMVKVYADEIVVRRLEFSSSKTLKGRGTICETLGPDWVFRRDGAEIIAPERNSAPEFWDDVRISVVPGYGKNGERIYSVRWPNLKTGNAGVRAMVYDFDDGRTNRTLVVSPGFFGPEGRDSSTLTRALSADKAPKRITITPIGAFGLRGDPVPVDLSR